MRRILLILFSALGVIGFTQAQSSGFTDLKPGERDLGISSIQKSKRTDAKRSMTRFAEEHPMYPGESLASAVARSQAKPSPTQTEENTPYTAAFSTTLSWGTVYALDASGDDLTQLFYTKALEANTNYPTNYNYYVGATFTFYNEKFVQVYQIHVESPKLVDGTTSAQCNDIQIIGEYSKNLYNSDAKWEFLFMTHWFKPDGQGKTGPETQQYTYYIYQHDNVRYRTLEKTEGVYQYAGSGNSTRKLIVCEYEYESDTTVLKLYAARDWGAAGAATTPPNPLKTHKIGTDQMIRMAAPLIIIETIAGVPRYTFPHYEQKYYATKNPSWTVTPNNKFVLDLYSLDVTSATTNNLYKSLTLPIEGFDAEKLSEIEFSLNFSDYNLTTNVFNTDANLEILYGVDDYYATCDCDMVNYYVVDETGAVLKSLKDLVTNVKLIKNLATLPGYGSQYAIFADTPNTTEISFFDIEDWAVVQKFTSVYKGEQLTSNFDRIATDTGYAYVFEMYDALKEGNDVYSKVNWYDAASGDLIKTVKFNLGPKGAYFSPAITPTTLNPYFINTDDQMEYIGAARIYPDNGGDAYSSFRIYNEDGDLLFISDANQNGQVFSGGMGAYSTGGISQYLILSYRTGASTRVYDFVSLPLTPLFPAGGAGTADNPYIITTAGDFDAVRINPSAKYKFANDIDLLPLLSTKYAVTGWKPFDLKEGARIDGDGYQIKNLKLQGITSSYASLFQQLNKNARLENLTIPNAEIILNASNTIGGSFIAYQLSDSASIRNVHITGNIGVGSGIGSSTQAAGLAIALSGGSNILQSSFEGNINIPVATGGNKSGIAANLSTGSFIVDCYSKGNISVQNTTAGYVGGIVGTMNNDAQGNTIRVRNSYSTMNINVGYTGQNLGAGGVVGNFNGTSGKGLVENCYSTGRITSVSTHASDNIFAGGVIGTTSANLNTNTRLNMSGLVALNDTVTAKKAGRVAGINSSDYTYDKIQNCYALSTVKIGKSGEEAAISSSRTDSIHGKDITREELTEAFYSGIGWAFGRNLESPWVWNENGIPRLWYEYLVIGVSLDQASALIDVEETFQLTATVAPFDAFNQQVTWVSSDPTVATVSETGFVTGLKFGTTTITATTEEGGFIAVCDVKVGLAESITLNKHELTLIVDEEETLTVAILPETATYTELIWTVVNDEDTNVIIASVDNTGKITAVEKGNCSVIVTLKNSELSDTCKVNVEPIVAINLPEANGVTVVNTKGKIEISSLNQLENITIYDVNGKTVYVSREKNNHLLIPTNHWNKGVFVIRITTDGKDLYKKLVIQ